jgi:hypothetical protein
MIMRNRRRHAAAPTCRECGSRVRFLRDGVTGTWRIFNVSPIASHSAPYGARVEWNGRAWEPLELEVELSTRRLPADTTPREEVLALTWLTPHACEVAATIASRTR